MRCMCIYIMHINNAYNVYQFHYYIPPNWIALQAEEVNEIAFNTYQRNGYVEVDRRPYIPFPGSDDAGDYVLMWKELT